MTNQPQSTKFHQVLPEILNFVIVQYKRVINVNKTCVNSNNQSKFKYKKGFVVFPKYEFLHNVTQTYQ